MEVYGILLSLFLVAFGVWWWRTAQRNRHFYQHIPCPPTVPFIGHLWDFATTADVLITITTYIKKYGDLLQVRLGPGVKFFVVADYKWLEFFLSTTKVMNKSEEYHGIRCWLGNGLLTADEHFWKKSRKILMPAFHYQILEQFLGVFDTQAEKLIRKLEMQLHRGSVDIYPYVALCSLDIICETIMGVSLNAQDNYSSEYVKSVHDMCRILVERSISIVEVNDFFFKFTRNFRKQKRNLKILHEKSNNVINQRRAELIELEDKGEEEDLGIKKRKPFLDILLTSKIDDRPLTQEEIREQVDTFLFAGHDTTAAALGFTLYCLANHADVQAKAYEEQAQIFQDDLYQSATHAHLASMKYLEMVIKESLRLYPPVPLTGRRTYEDVIYDGKVLPQGDTIMLFIFGMHRNPDYFPDPETFNPSRFEVSDGSKPYAYLPFSAGPRNCIGQKFAMLEIKSIISRILRKFELLPAVPAHCLQLVAETVLKSKTGMKIRLEYRSSEHKTA